MSDTNLNPTQAGNLIRLVNYAIDRAEPKIVSTPNGDENAIAQAQTTFKAFAKWVASSQSDRTKAGKTDTNMAINALHENLETLKALLPQATYQRLVGVAFLAEYAGEELPKTQDITRDDPFFAKLCAKYERIAQDSKVPANDVPIDGEALVAVWKDSKTAPEYGGYFEALLGNVSTAGELQRFIYTYLDNIEQLKLGWQDKKNFRTGLTELLDHANTVIAKTNPNAAPMEIEGLAAAAHR